MFNTLSGSNSKPMNEHFRSLYKRRSVATIVVIAFALLALIYNYFFQVTTPVYFDGKYNMELVYGLIVYKLIELPVIYYILFQRYIFALKKERYSLEKYPKLQKHTKLLFFLVPQGNTIFGLIAYKLSGNVLFFVLFSIIALISLYFIKIDKIKNAINNHC